PPEDERGAPIRVQVRDPAELCHARLPPSLDHLEKGAVDAELGAERVGSERALVELLRLLEVAAADQLPDHLGGEREVSTRIVAGPGQGGLEVLFVSSGGRLRLSSTADGAGGGVALAARLLLLREPQPERTEED